MSELTYKKIVDVEQVETLNDAATVFINDNGAMKQVAADKFGAVKTVNGVEPDENGEVYIGEQVAYLFADGTALVPDLYTWYGPGTLADAVGRLGTTNKEITEIHRLIMTPSGAGRMYKSIGHEKIKNADSSYNARILFGDNICPVIFDTVNNKIITDPDWVKPEENAGGSGGAFDAVIFSTEVPPLINEGNTTLKKGDYASLVAKALSGEPVSIVFACDGISDDDGRRTVRIFTSREVQFYNPVKESQSQQSRIFVYFDIDGEEKRLSIEEDNSILYM